MPRMAQPSSRIVGAAPNGAFQKSPVAEKLRYGRTVGDGPRARHLASPTTGLGGRFDAVWVFTWASGGGTISGGRVLWKFRQRVPYWLPW